jgi:glyoxylase-like metal-dependent hydrolase (beta-lactamase superfamily II)
MQIEHFSTGRVRLKATPRGMRRYLPGGWSGETLPVHVFLVHHRQGLCLFDAGQTARATRPGYHPWWHPYLRLARFELASGDEIGPQLRTREIDPGSVRWLVLSHLHTDHVGGVGAFPQAEVLVSRIEWARASGISGRLRGYVPQHWPLADPVLVDPTGPAIGPFAGSFDVAGDGELLLVPTPGHTPGHLSMLVRDRAVTGGGALLGGDIAHAPAELPAPVARFCAEERLVVLLTHDRDL